MPNNRPARRVLSEPRGKKDQSEERLTRQEKRTLPRAQKHIKKRIEVARDGEAAFSDLRERIAESLSGTNADTHAVDNLLALFVEQLGDQTVLQRARTNHAAEHAQGTERPTRDRFTDRETGLLLPPPPPAEYYSGHQARLKKRLLPEEFLRRFWTAYVVDHPHMLFAPHLREHDSALAAALRNRARALGEPVDDFFFNNGILTRAHVSLPPKGLEHQAGLFKAMSHARHAAATLQRLPESIASSASVRQEPSTVSTTSTVKSRSRDLTK